ncbi:unnamed protein product [Ilex paraguariensis]|uniref:Peptidase A1 domain-containing protein n=1 Tax=Ilex paraguariensis TaxID=185542 RepID=A0ABC8RUA4_9AQUA
MTGNAVFLAPCLFCNLLALSLLSCILSNPTGFSLKLIYGDSLESRLYMRKLNNLERFQTDVEISKSRASNLKLIGKTSVGNGTLLPDIIRPSLTYRDRLYTVDIDFGTPPRKGTFIFDTEYLSRQSSKGVASLETFTFPSNTRAPKSIRDIVFGCGFDNQGSLGSDTSVSGILGMDRSPVSLVSQLGVSIMRRFSYCLPAFDSRFRTSFLRFGNDIVIKGGHVQTTPFLRDTGYKLNLSGISIDGRRLVLPPGTFSGGCVIDSGGTQSIIEQRAYTLLLNAFVVHFVRFRNLKRVADTKGTRDLCYRYSGGFNGFPSMTFHFQGANLEVPRTSLFKLERSTFCLEMKGHPSKTILGAYQQQNVRFIYDIGNSSLSFVREDCSKDRRA